MTILNQSAELSRASALDALRFLDDVAVPTIGKGVILRRPAGEKLAEWLALDRRAVRRCQALRRRYGEGPLLLPNPVRRQVLVMSAGDVRRVLDETPAPFSPASSEKRAALSHFQPHGSLISAGPERAVRRAASDRSLESGSARHSMGERFRGIAREEAQMLLRRARGLGELNWTLFADAWARTVRRVVLGDGARDDRALTDGIFRLRARANWAFAAPKDRELRAAVHRDLRRHLDRAEAGSLAAILAERVREPDAHPADQVLQWLFAFDPAGMATLRTLALLCVHDRARARAEEEARDAASGHDFLRACLVDCLRLFPTTPMILRQTTTETRWPGGTLPAGTGVLIFVPFFTRDDERLAEADRFAPEQWLLLDPAQRVPLVPFSSGPGACPARHLVPMLAAEWLASVVGTHRVRLIGRHGMRPERKLPPTLDHYTLRFEVALG